MALMSCFSSRLRRINPGGISLRWAADTEAALIGTFRIGMTGPGIPVPVAGSPFSPRVGLETVALVDRKDERAAGGRVTPTCTTTQSPP